MWSTVALVALLAALVLGGIIYVKKSSASAVELEQAEAILAQERAKRAAIEKQLAEEKRVRDEEFNEKRDAVRTADDAAEFLRQIGAGTHGD